LNCDDGVGDGSLPLTVKETAKTECGSLWLFPLCDPYASNA